MPDASHDEQEQSGGVGEEDDPQTAFDVAEPGDDAKQYGGYVNAEKR